MKNIATIVFILLNFSLFDQIEAQHVFDIFRNQAKKHVSNLEGIAVDQTLDTLASKTNLMYYFGSNESQLLQINHDQQFNKFGVVRFGHVMSASDGTLIHDIFRTNHSRLQHQLEEGRVSNNLSVTYFTDGRKLNGGLLSDSLFQFTSLDQEFLPVNLSDNSSNYKRFNVRDTLLVRVHDRWFLSGLLDYSHVDRNYQGNGILDSTFYDTVYLSDGPFVDYFRNRNLKYGVGTRFVDSSMTLDVTAFVNNDYFYNLIRRNWYGAGASVRLGVMLGKTQLKTLAEYHFSGYRKSGCSASISLNAPVDSLNRLKVEFSSTLLPVEYNLLAYSGNHFVWNMENMTFPWTNTLNVAYNDSVRKLDVVIGGMYAQNYFFFDTSMVASQVESAHFASLSLRKRFSLRNLYFPIRLTTNFGQSEQIRLPTINATAGVFVGMRLFKANLKVDFGAQCNWFSKYFANQFEPSTGNVYLQNNSEIGAFPFVDLMLRSTVKNASFYVMMTHVNENLTGRNYYIRPNYLELASRFIFGINWQFLN